jgi:nucleoside-diphosphate-sugar epimerase
MKVFVTGATGYIGREIVSELSNSGYEVIALGNSKNISFEEKQKNLVFRRADITDYKNLKGLENIEGVDALIHAAGLAHQFGETKKEDFDAVNIRGTENILSLALKLKIKHFILIGTTAVYGIAAKDKANKLPVFDENAPVAPQTLYAASKLESEIICRRICEDNRIALTIFRLAPVLGEDNAGNAARLIEAIDKNRFVWIGDGENLKTLIYKRDVARACVHLIDKKTSGTEIYNLADEPIKMKDFVGEISSRLNRRIFPLKIPASFLRAFFSINSKTINSRKMNKMSETVVKWLSDDVYLAGKILDVHGFQPSVLTREAIARQVEYYLACKKAGQK